MTNEKDQKTSLIPIKKLCDAGSNITGGLVSVAVGTAFAGIPGAFAGALIGPIVTSLSGTAIDFLSQQLSQSENEKIGAGFAFAIHKISERSKKGEKIRTDNFFKSDINARSPAKEILEGVLLKCKNEYEIKKLRLIGNIFGNAAFMNISPENISSILKITERLTYRQLCILAIPYCKISPKIKGPLLLTINQGMVTTTDFSQILSQEINELKQLKLISFGYRKDISFFMQTHSFSSVVSKLLSLDQIPEEDFSAVFNQTNLRSDDSGAIFVGPSTKK